MGGDVDAYTANLPLNPTVSNCGSNVPAVLFKNPLCSNK